MILHKVRVYPSKIKLIKKKQLAWKIAEVASDNSKLNKFSVDMAINRIIDNASVAIASLNRKAVIASREMALKHPKKNGANIFGVNKDLNYLFLNFLQLISRKNLEWILFLKKDIFWIKLLLLF